MPKMRLTPEEAKKMVENGGRKPAPKISLKAVGRLIKMLAKDYPFMLTAVGICIVLAAVIGVLPAIYIKTLTDYILEGLAAGWGAVQGKIVTAISIMVACYIVGLMCSTAQGILLARITQGFLHKIRTRMFDKLQHLPIRYFDTNSDGDIMSHFTNDTDTLRMLVSQGLPQMFSAVLTIIALLFIMMYYSITLMIVALFGIFAMFVVTKKIGGGSARYFIQQQVSLGETEGCIEEMVHGQKVVKVFNHQDTAIKQFDELNEKLCSDAVKANTYANLLAPITMNIGNILYVLSAFVGGLICLTGGNIPNASFEGLISGAGFISALTLPVVASYLGMVKQFTANVNQVAQNISSVAMAMAGAERVFGMIDTPPERNSGYVTLVNARKDESGNIVESNEVTGMWAWRHPHGDGTLTYTELKGDIQVLNVDFTYEKGKPDVLHDISFYAKPGQKIAFVGATGAGKTTITNLLSRFYYIPDGKIRYDGININKILKEDLRRSFGMVLQDVHLFTGTVMENIRYGKLDATDEECIAAAKLANADSFIRRLPDGYDTMLTQSGANLSQGQRQLISIARAAVANPPVMILDEATSSIDTRTETLVQKGMDNLMKGRTVFVIAHRLSTVRDSNAIMVLDHGRIIERGTHDELIAQKGTYYRLYTGDFELE